MFLRKYPLKLFKYWFAGYLIGVFLAVIFVSLQTGKFLWYDPDTKGLKEFYSMEYKRDNWIPYYEDIKWNYYALWPPGMREMYYQMHISKGENRSVADALAQRIRVFCIVMTTPVYHKTRTRLIKDTWGRRCDGLIFMSTQADESLPTVAINTSNDDPWGRFKEAIQYVNHHHADKADWFVKATDDTYIIMENLKYMLNNYSSSEASFFGYMSDGPTVMEQSTKAGYVLSKAALKAVVECGSRACKTYSRKDYQLSECLRILKIKIVDTHDTVGRARFFPYNPSRLHQSLTGASDYAISFDRISDTFLYVMELFVYHLRAYGIVANYSVPELYHVPNSEPRVLDEVQKEEEVDVHNMTD